MKTKWVGYGLGVLALSAALTRTTVALGEDVGVLNGVMGWGGAALRIEASGDGTRRPQGYLGVDVRDVSEESVSLLKLREARGAEIIRVDHDAPAGKMGLREHDVVLQLNGVAVEGEEQIRRMLRELAPGRTIALLISRDGRQLSVTGQMADQGEVEREAWERHLSPATVPGGPQAPATALPGADGTPSASGGFPSTSGGSATPGAAATQSRYGKSFLGSLLTSPTYTGVMLEAMRPQLAQFFAIPGGAGLLVESVESNSPAAMAGIRAGDVVVRANLQPVGSPSRWAKMIREAKGRPVLVTVVRDRQEHTFTLIPDTKHR